jgi:DNA repair protein RecO (recombination protein O)
VLRRFEVACCKGTSGGNAGIEADAVYYVSAWPGRGSARDSVQLRGKTLLDMAARLRDPLTQQQSKMLMRALLNHHLGEQTLHTRQMLRELQEF